MIRTWLNSTPYLLGDEPDALTRAKRSMERATQLRNEAIDYLKGLSQRIWDDYRNVSAVRQHILPASIEWAD